MHRLIKKELSQDIRNVFKNRHVIQIHEFINPRTRHLIHDVDQKYTFTIRGYSYTYCTFRTILSGRVLSFKETNVMKTLQHNTSCW